MATKAIICSTGDRGQAYFVLWKGVFEKSTGVSVQINIAVLTGVLALAVMTPFEVGAVDAYEVDGLVSVEAESAHTRGKWREGGPDRNSSAKYMIAQSANAPGDSMGFSIEFKKTGIYWVYLRARAVSGRDGDWTRHNDAYVYLDRQPCVVAVGSEWRAVEGIRSANVTYFLLANEGKLGAEPPAWARTPVAVRVNSAGRHSLQVGARSSEYEVDKIVLLHDSRPDAKTTLMTFNPPATATPGTLSRHLARPIPPSSGSHGETTRMTLLTGGAGSMYCQMSYLLNGALSGNRLIRGISIQNHYRRER